MTATDGGDWWIAQHVSASTTPSEEEKDCVFVDKFKYRSHLSLEDAPVSSPSK